MSKYLLKLRNVDAPVTAFADLPIVVEVENSWIFLLEFSEKFPAQRGHQ